MSELERVRGLVKRTNLPRRRRLRVDTNEHGMVFVQCQGLVRDFTDPLDPGPLSWQGGAKHYISQHACDDEIFQAFLAFVLAFDEHETREAFLVDGRRIFGPHISVQALAEVCDRTAVRA